MTGSVFYLLGSFILVLFDETPDKGTGSLGGGIENVQVVWFRKTHQKLTFVPYCSKVSCDYVQR